MHEGGDILGGMARELDSEMLRRLQEQYGEMSDGELLGLAAKPDELTDLALEVLRGEIGRRGIKLVIETPIADEFPGPVDDVPGVKPMPDGSVPLTTFNDAITAREACRYLEEDGLEIDVRDLSAATRGGSFYGGPPVALQVVVRSGDAERARRLLQEKMGLFPVVEAQGDDAPEDDALLTLATFGHRQDADGVGRVLDEAGIWHRVTANPDGSVETEDAFDVEVKQVDQPRALEIVEKAMGISEG